jgi:hypothetical protein
VSLKINSYKIDIDPGPTETRSTARQRGRKPLLARRPRPFRNVATRQTWLPFDRE